MRHAFTLINTENMQEGYKVYGFNFWEPQKNRTKEVRPWRRHFLPRNGPTGLLSNSGRNQYTTAFSVDTVLQFRCLVTKITKTQAV